MNILQATASYEVWLSKRLNIIARDLAGKHAAMAADSFAFLRATFYRWMQLWPAICPAPDQAPKILAVGDLHIENFGTWRDAEGRLVWGINDFDEAFPLPYTLDLVRLAASVSLAIRGAHLKIALQDACDDVLAGYRHGLESGGQPFVLEEKHAWLRSAVTGEARDPVRFWARFDKLPTLRTRPPRSAGRALERMLPADAAAYRLVHRVAGLGSLGRERFVAIADHHGGMVAREAKALAPSACIWAGAAGGSKKLRYQEILDTAVRSADPFVRLKGRWIVRRLAPDCSRVELAALSRKRDERRLLRAMGFEAANVHLGTKNAARPILKDLRKRPSDWLLLAAEAMVKATTADWREWRHRRRR